MENIKLTNAELQLMVTCKYWDTFNVNHQQRLQQVITGPTTHLGVKYCFNVFERFLEARVYSSYFKDSAIYIDVFADEEDYGSFVVLTQEEEAI